MVQGPTKCPHTNVEGKVSSLANVSGKDTERIHIARTKTVGRVAQWPVQFPLGNEG